MNLLARLLALCLFGSSLAAEVWLDASFHDGMMLPGGSPVHIHGTCDVTSEITVELAGHTKSTLPAKGKWCVQLPALAAGGPHKLTVTNGNTITITGIQVIDTDQADRPNVVLVITDDQGYPNLGAAGHPILRTPHLDRLHANSVRLNDYHVDPTCAPTRASLMTGRYSNRTGVWHTVLGRHQMRRREVTMAEVLRDAGYRTGLFGKWHLGDLYPFRAQDRGFEKTVTHAAGGIGQGPDYWGNDYFDDTYQVDGRWQPFTGFCTDVFFREAMHFIDECTAGDRPFFVMVSTNAPHGPFYAPERSYARFRGYKHAGEEMTEATGRYYGMIENIDENVGQLADFLRDQGLFDNTIFIFTSDNGPVLGQAIGWFNDNLRGHKGSNYDGGHQVPFLISWPDGDLAGGHDVDHTTAHIDILPTLIELCELAAPAVKMDGTSIAALLRGDDSNWQPRHLVVESQRVYDPVKYRKYAVLTDGWRLVDQTELYHVAQDRGQQHNVADTHPEQFAAMSAAYEAWWADVSQDHHISSLPIVGANQANPVVLNSHDWTTEGFWNQSHILRPFARRFKPTGKWVMEVAEPGWYQVSLRRWPAEADQPINAAYVGDAISVDRATLRIQGHEQSQPIPTNAHEVTFRVELRAGKTEVDAVFTSRNGAAPVSPFYAYILRETGRDHSGWQTRRGLGLPPAQWPAHHGADPTAPQAAGPSTAPEFL